MLSVESNGPVLFVTLNRPEVRNAFNQELIQRLYDVFTQLSGEVRAVVLTGNGPAFCAGGDLNWMREAASYTEEQNYQDALKLAKLYQAMVDCPAVVVAKLHGSVFGGGCGLVAAADIALATTDTQFAFSEVRLGLVPATISPFVITKIGPSHARALFVTGEVFDATKALQIGLIHGVGSLEERDAILEAKLNAILSVGPKAVTVSKRLATQPLLGQEASARLLAQVRAGEEAAEGIAAFLDRRSPSFKVKR